MPSNHSFLAGSNVAVFGVSPKRKTFAHTVKEALSNAGYNVYTIHPSGDTDSFKDLESLPEKTEAVYIATGKANSSKIVDQAISYGAKRVWLQFGAYDKEIVKKCKDAGMETHTGCLMMYIPDAGVMHVVHRFVHELLAGKP